MKEIVNWFMIILNFKIPVPISFNSNSIGYISVFGILTFLVFIAFISYIIYKAFK